MSESEKALKENSKPAETPETDIKEIFEDLPEPIREQITTSILSMKASSSVSPISPILEKVGSEHITQYLDSAREESRSEFKDRTQNRIFIFLLILLALCFIVVLIFLLEDKPEFLEKIISHIAVLVVGAFGGYGFGRKKQSTDN